MSNQPILLMAVVLGLSLYMGIMWLSTLLGVVGFFMLLGSIPTKSAVPQGGPQDKEVLTPVIVTDVGQPPYLYPPDFRLKVKPNWRANNMFENMAQGVGFMGKGIGQTLAGGPIGGRKGV